MILLTGATGYIGGFLRRDLERDHEVAILTRKGGEGQLHYRGGTGEIREFFRSHDVDSVIHLAAAFNGDNHDLVQANLLLGSQLLEVMHETGCRRFVNTGTFSEYGEGPAPKAKTFYDATKQAFGSLLDYYAAAENFSVITLKLYDVYGPRDPRRKILNLLFEAARTGEVLPVSAAEQRIEMLYVDDVVAGYRQALADLRPGHRTYFLTDPQNRFTLKEVIEAYECEFGQKLPLAWGARPYHPREIMNPYAGPVLPGWTPRTSLTEGLRQVIESQRKAPKT